MITEELPTHMVLVVRLSLSPSLPHSWQMPSRKSWSRKPVCGCPPMLPGCFALDCDSRTGKHGGDTGGNQRASGYRISCLRILFRTICHGVMTTELSKQNRKEDQCIHQHPLPIFHPCASITTLPALQRGNKIP